MNIQTLRKHLPGARIGRASGRGKDRSISVAAAGLNYQIDPTRFASEKDLAEHLRSKIPVLTISNPPNL